MFHITMSYRTSQRTFFSFALLLAICHVEAAYLDGIAMLNSFDLLRHFYITLQSPSVLHLRCPHKFTTHFVLLLNFFQYFYYLINFFNQLTRENCRHPLLLHLTLFLIDHKFLLHFSESTNGFFLIKFC